MITISTHVFQWLASNPFVKQHLQQGLINHSALARHIQKDINAKAGETVSIDAITIALNRIGKKETGSTSESNYSRYIGDISMQTGLSVIALPADKHRPIVDASTIPTSSDDYFLATKGVWHTALMTKTETVDSLKINSADVLYRADNLVGVTIKLNKGHIPVPGVAAYILMILANRGINLDEIVSTHNEMTIITDTSNAEDIVRVLINAR